VSVRLILAENASLVFLIVHGVHEFMCPISIACIKLKLIPESQNPVAMISDWPKKCLIPTVCVCEKGR